MKKSSVVRRERARNSINVLESRPRSLPPEKEQRHTKHSLNAGKRHNGKVKRPITEPTTYRKEKTMNSSGTVHLFRYAGLKQKSPSSPSNYSDRRPSNNAGRRAVIVWRSVGSVVSAAMSAPPLAPLLGRSILHLHRSMRSRQKLRRYYPRAKHLTPKP